MRIFQFDDPFDYDFAQAGSRGTWYPDPGPGACPKCGAARQERVPPLIIEWLPDSDVVGDFTWASEELVVSQQVGEILKERFRGIELKPIEMWQDPRLRPPQRITKRTKPRVWLPYKGPPLYELYATTWIHADANHSSLRLVNDCPVCGYKAYEVTGVEERKSRWDPIQQGLVKIHTPRVSGKGIYVDSKSLQGVDIFRLFEFPTWLFCTEKVKVFIEKERFTNISFLEMGDVL